MGGTLLHDRLENTLDWMAAKLGISDPPHRSRGLRRAVRDLGSEEPTLRLHAEARLSAEQRHAAPLLRQAARSQSPVLRSLRAVMLLHRFQDGDAVGIVRHMAHERRLRCGDAGELLRRAVVEVIGTEHYARQATAALKRLEQRPEVDSAIARFCHAVEVLGFVGAPLPAEVLRRALVVRTIGGEDLAVVRDVLTEGSEPAEEHISMARKSAAAMTAALGDRQKAYSMLLRRLGHPNPTVGLTAMYGLDMLGDTRAIAPLMAIAYNEDSPIRQDARLLIARLNAGTPDCLTLLRPYPISENLPSEMLRAAVQHPDEETTTLVRPHKGIGADAA